MTFVTEWPALNGLEEETLHAYEMTFDNCLAIMDRVSDQIDAAHEEGWVKQEAALCSFFSQATGLINHKTSIAGVLVIRATQLMQDCSNEVLDVMQPLEEELEHGFGYCMEKFDKC